jgi:hypothetical protein
MVSTGGCRSRPLAGQENGANAKPELHLQTVEPHLQTNGPSVFFGLKPTSITPALSEFREYNCTYQEGGKTARFRIELKQTRHMSGKIQVAPGEGKFLAGAGSENLVLLQALKKALDAKTIPKASRRVEELAFDAIVLGQNQSRGPSGSFSNNPPGEWIAIKIFLTKGGDDGELFLNLNPTLGKGEFSLKDSGYGDYLMQELAKVL